MYRREPFSVVVEDGSMGDILWVWVGVALDIYVVYV